MTCQGSQMALGTTDFLDGLSRTLVPMPGESLGLGVGPSKGRYLVEPECQHPLSPTEGPGHPCGLQDTLAGSSWSGLWLPGHSPCLRCGCKSVGNGNTHRDGEWARVASACPAMADADMH